MGRKIQILRAGELTGIPDGSSLRWYLSGRIPHVLQDANLRFLKGEIREYTFFKEAGELLGIPNLAGKVRKKLSSLIHVKSVQENIRKLTAPCADCSTQEYCTVVAGNADPVIAEYLVTAADSKDFPDYWFLSCETGMLYEDPEFSKLIDKYLSNGAL